MATPVTSPPSIRQVHSPLTREQLRPLDGACRVVQFSSLLTDQDFARLGTFMSDYPDVTLRAYAGYDGSITDLEFLRYFPRLRHFAADALRYHGLTSLDGLCHLPTDVESLVIGNTRTKLSLAILERFRDLRTLFIEGQAKDIAVISDLTNLRDVTLRSVTLPDLGLLTSLHRLRSLDLKLGGTHNLDLLPDLRGLRYLELWMVRGLDAIAAVAKLPDLRSLFLESLKGVTELPSFARNTLLRRIHIQRLTGLRDLSPLASAPRLEQVLLVDMGHLQATDVVPLKDVASLTHATLGLNSARRNREAEAIVRLPRAQSRVEQFPEFVNRGLLDWSRGDDDGECTPL